METIVTNYIRENKVNIFVAISRYIVCNVTKLVFNHTHKITKTASLFQENCGENDNKEAGRQQHTWWKD